MVADTSNAPFCQNGFQDVCSEKGKSLQKNKDTHEYSIMTEEVISSRFETQVRSFTKS